MHLYEAHQYKDEILTEIRLLLLAELHTAAESMMDIDNAKILMDQVGSGAQPDDLFKDNNKFDKHRPHMYEQNGHGTPRDLLQPKNTSTYAMAYMKEGAVICREW